MGRGRAKRSLSQEPRVGKSEHYDVGSNHCDSQSEPPSQTFVNQWIDSHFKKGNEQTNPTFVSRKEKQEHEQSVEEVINFLADGDCSSQTPCEYYPKAE